MSPKFSKRPYGFGSPAAKREYNAECVALNAAYDTCSERYLAGDPTVIFPPGTYPPPIIVPAA